MSFIYLAQPYFDPDPNIRELRYQAGMDVLAAYMKAGWTTYAPIVHCHELAKKHDLPKDWTFWEHHDFNMLEKAAQLHVLRLPGWEKSRGVEAETKFAAQEEIIIEYIDYNKIIGGDLSHV